MMTLQFADTHNLVVFFARPTESEGFEQIVDFLNAHTIKYALTVNPTIYTSCIEQFWATVKAKTINEEVQLQALLDWKKIIVTEASIRSDRQLNDEEGIDCLPNTTIFEELTRMGYENFHKSLHSIRHSFLYNGNSLFIQQLEGMSSHKRIYVTPSHTKKIFRNMKRVRKGFSRMETPLFPTMVVQNQAEMGEGSAIPTYPYHTPTIIQPSTSQPQKKQRSRRPKRKDTEVPQPSGPIANVVYEAVNEEMDDNLERAATTATSLNVEQDRGNINKTQSKETPNDPSSLGTSSGGGPRRQETIGDTIAQTRFEYVSKFSNDPFLARGNILRSGKDSLKLQELMELFKKLEKKGGSRTHKLKKLYKVGRSTRIVSSDEASLGDQEDSSKQGRKIDDIDKDPKITLVDETQGRYGDDIMFDVSDLAGEEVFVAEQGVSDKDVKLSVDEVTLAQALAALKSAKVQDKANVVEEPSESITTTPTLTTTTATTIITATSTRPMPKGLVIHEQEQAPTPIVSSQQPLQAKIQDKGKAKMIKPEPMKKLSKKINSGWMRKWFKETWDELQAKIEADQLLGERLQAREQEELTIEERAILFQQLLEKRRNTLQQKEQKRKRIDHQQKLNKGVSCIAQESSSKIVGDELEQESIKKQKVDKDKETTELKSPMEVIPDEESRA
ncbi:hypothetical protein Tco_1491794 [Tanacetum coccineum]